MASVHWTPGARLDLLRIVRTIGADSPVYGTAFLSRIDVDVGRLEDFPKLGRVVPEYEDGNLRELLVGSYRVVYGIQNDEVAIIAIVHGARLNEVSRLSAVGVEVKCLSCLK